MRFVLFGATRDRPIIKLPSRLELNAYAKVPNIPYITLTRFDIEGYPAGTTPFIIRDNLILETITEKQSIIEPDTEYMPPEPAIIKAL